MAAIGCGVAVATGCQRCVRELTPIDAQPGTPLDLSAVDAILIVD